MTDKPKKKKRSQMSYPLTEYGKQRAKDIREIIEANATNPKFDQKDVIERFGYKLTEVNIRRCGYNLTMKAFGMSFTDIIMAERIRIAYKMLKAGKVRPKDIFKTMGFFISWIPRLRPDTRRAMLMEFGQWKEHADKKLALFGGKRLIMGENCKVPGPLPEWYKKREKS